jgi:hypothetical protein
MKVQFNLFGFEIQVCVTRPLYEVHVFPDDGYGSNVGWLGNWTWWRARLQAWDHARSWTIDARVPHTYVLYRLDSEGNRTSVIPDYCKTTVISSRVKFFGK